MNRRGSNYWSNVDDSCVKCDRSKICPETNYYSKGFDRKLHVLEQNGLVVQHVKSNSRIVGQTGSNNYSNAIESWENRRNIFLSFSILKQIIKHFTTQLFKLTTKSIVKPIRRLADKRESKIKVKKLKKKN